MSNRKVSFKIRDEAATARIAKAMSADVGARDTILLEGDIGAGKSAFSRALIRTLCGEEIDVPSPTYTIVQTYDAKGFEIWHCDLYRLGDINDVIELGIEAAFNEALVLVEWPDRLGDLKPQNALTISIEITNDGRCFVLDGSDRWLKPLANFDV